jgi:hypothetical protein
MIQFFKLGTWDRLVVLCILFALMQGPFLLFGDRIMVPELLWLRLGERLGSGWRLYVQAMDENGPLSALLYAGLARLRLDDFHIYRYLGSGLILAQAIWFNGLCNRYSLFNDRSYLVAFFYIVFSHLGPDGLSLTPALLATSFILLAYGRLFKLIKSGANAEDAMYMGFCLGLAFLFYQPALLFVIPFLVGALFFSGFRLNQYVIVIVASLLPLGFCYSFFVWGGGEQIFWTCLLKPFRIGFLVSWVDWNLMLGLGSFLVLLSLWGWAIANQNSRVNFQQLGFTVFFFGLPVAGLIQFLGSMQSTFLLFFLVPYAAFFIAQLMANTRGILFQEITGLLILIVMLGSFYGMAEPSFGKKIMGHSLYAEEPPKGFVVHFREKPLLLLSDDFRFYKYNPAAGSLFKFYLSGIRPEYAKTYEGLIFWYQVLAEDPPALIYDPNDLIPAIAVRIPEFGKCYKASFYPHLYEKIPRRIFGKKESTIR